MRLRLTPRETSFYDMFAASADNIVTGSKLLMELLGADASARSEIADRMRAAEHAGDDATHAIISQLNSSFITPFDREDIYRLAGSLDDVMDYMEEAVDLVVLYQIEELPKGVEQQIEVLASGRGADRRGDAAAAHDEGPHRVLDRGQPAREPGGPDPPQAARAAVQRRVRGDGRYSSSRRSWTSSKRPRTRSSTWRTPSRPSRSRSPDRGGTFALVVVIGVALSFNYTNGFHDAANAIATSVSTRALTPRVALAMAAVMNLVGAFSAPASRRPSARASSTARAASAGLVDPVRGPDRRDRLEPDHLVLRPAVVLLPRPDRRPGRRGAGRRRARSTGAAWSDKVVIPMVLSPVVGLVRRLPRHGRDPVDLPERQPGARSRAASGCAQTVSAAAMALGHGLQDAQKTMGVIVLALVIGGYDTGRRHPDLGLIAVAPPSISLGTYAGGWRIMRTLGRRIIHLDPPQGFAAETTAAVDRSTSPACVFERADLDHAHHHLGDHGCRRHQAALGGPLGRRAEHRRRLDAHLPGGGLVAAARLPDRAAWSVCRSGRPSGPPEGGPTP